MVRHPQHRQQAVIHRGQRRRPIRRYYRGLDWTDTANREQQTGVGSWAPWAVEDMTVQELQALLGKMLDTLGRNHQPLNRDRRGAVG